jgi:hypothetical protein
VEARNQAVGVSVIYGLFDPIDGAMRYVGRTRGRLKERLSHHLICPTNEKMRQWFGQLAMIGHRPHIEQLSACISRDEGKEEKRMIDRYLSCGLLNYCKIANFEMC